MNFEKNMNSPTERSEMKDKLPCSHCGDTLKCQCSLTTTSPSSFYLSSILNNNDGSSGSEGGGGHFSHFRPPQQSIQPQISSRNGIRIEEEFDSEECKKPSRGGRWTPDEHERFLAGFRIHGHKWKRVQHVVKTRTVTQVRTHAQKFLLKQRKAEFEEYDTSRLMSGKHSLDGNGTDSSSQTAETDQQMIQDAAVTLCSILTLTSSEKESIKGLAGASHFDDGIKRKQYLCRKCKVPKKGHVCANEDDTTDTSPDKTPFKRVKTTSAATSNKRPRITIAESVPSLPSPEEPVVKVDEKNDQPQVEPPVSIDVSATIPAAAEVLPVEQLFDEPAGVEELPEEIAPPPTAVTSNDMKVESKKDPLPQSAIAPLTGRRVLRLRGHETWSRGIIQAVYRGSIYLVYENNDNPEWMTNAEAEKCLAIATGRVVSAKMRRLGVYWPAQTYVLLKVTDSPRVWTMVQFLDEHSTSWIGRQDIRTFDMKDYGNRMPFTDPSLARAVRMAQKIKEKNEALQLKPQ